MKAIVISKAGGVEKLIYREVSKPKIKPNWSLIKVKGFGINHSEIFTREGKSPTVQFPRIIGIECVGEIEETSDPNRLAIGQKVISMMGEMGRAFDGSYAEYVLVPNEQIYPVETTLSWRELATIPESYFTAFGSLEKLQLKETDRVLVRGATSGVGLAFLKLLKAKYKNIHVNGTSRSLAKEKLLLEAGFSAVIEDKKGQLQTNHNYQKILELVGPATIKNSIKHIETNGIICSTGQLGGRWFLEEFDPIIDLNRAYLTSFYSGVVNEKKLAELFKFIKKYRIQIEPEKIFCLKEIQQAHEYLESSHSFGKVIILIED
ncbi:alcohol dehydrogenase catalytic domain-containing protein [Enterococcus sp. LJL99]